jgi:hypothetical protein
MSFERKSLPRPINDKLAKRGAKRATARKGQLVAFIKGSAHGETESSRLKSARNDAFLIEMEDMKNRKLPYYLVDLNPSERQLKIFDTLFIVPEMVQKLFDSQAIKTPDINEFLLGNKESFYSATGSDAWARCVPFIRGFTELYEHSDMISLEVPVGDNCSISRDNKIFIGSLSIGLIDPSNEVRVKIVQQWREHEGFRYLKSFSLLKFNGSYYAKIKYSEDRFFLQKNKDLFRELVGTFDVLVERKQWAEERESKSFSRTEISDSSSRIAIGSPVNHAHQRNPKKKW